MEYAILVPHGVDPLPCLERCRTLKTQKNPCHALRPLKSNRTAVGLTRASISSKRLLFDGLPGHSAKTRFALLPGNDGHWNNERNPRMRRNSARPYIAL